MSCACLLACTHAGSWDSHQTFSNSWDTTAKYILLMDSLINSRALQPLNSRLELFTKVCNSLIGDVWIFLDAKDRKKMDQLGPLEAQSWTLCSWWLLSRVGEEGGAHTRKVPCLALLESNAVQAGKLLPVATHHSSPLRGVRSFVTCSGRVDWPQHALCTSTDVKITSRRQRWFMMREGAVIAGMCGTWVTVAGQRAPVPAGDQGGDTWPQLPVQGAQVPMVGLERLQRCCKWQRHK